VHIDLSQLIGFPLNTVFRVEGEKVLEEKNVDLFFFPNDDELVDSEGEEEVPKDNRNRLD
jgi:hypothetical protein